MVSLRKVDVKIQPSSTFSASSISSSGQRAWDDFLVTDKESSSGNTSTLPTKVCFDEHRCKIDFLYIVNQTYAVPFYPQ